MVYLARLNDQDYRIEVEPENGQVTVRINGRVINLTAAKPGYSSPIEFEADGITHRIYLSRQEDDFICWINSRLVRLTLIDEKRALYGQIAGASQAVGRKDVLKAPMPGLIVKIEVTPGQRVEKGHGLIVMEAMKMENELRATHAGTIKGIKVVEHQTVDKDQVLLEFDSGL